MTAIQIRNLLADIPDPEIPVITISDLGILRSVDVSDEKVTISITPTYNGCPAMQAISQSITETLHENGIDNVEIKTVFFPVWTTDWMTDDAKERLRKYGISPPTKVALQDRQILCPRCGSKDVKLVSQFGSTACKSLYTCSACLEPFDHFKCH
jgi:ring-1,2-phenylacetyl-CoA epoxidase subunit PaaD